MPTDKTAAPVSYRRASEFDNFGKSLEAILDRDVILRRYSVQERNLRDRETGDKAERTFVVVYVNETDNAEVTPIVYHAWSDDLANKLAEIPDDALPVLIKFVRITTGGGYKVYSYE